MSEDDRSEDSALDQRLIWDIFDSMEAIRVFSAAPPPPLLTGAEIEKLLKPLTQSEREILSLRFGFDLGVPHTLEEVGEYFDLPRERVREIEFRSMAKIRQAATDQLLGDSDEDG